MTKLKNNTQETKQNIRTLQMALPVKPGGHVLMLQTNILFFHGN